MQNVLAFIFLHFYICNVLFVVANNRILVFTEFLIYFKVYYFKVYNNVFTCKYVQIL